MHGVVDRIIDQRRALLHFKLRIDEKPLPEEFFLVENAMARKEGTVFQGDRIGRAHGFPSRQLFFAPSIASATISASLLFATSCTRKMAAPAMRQQGRGRRGGGIAVRRLSFGDGTKEPLA